MRTPPPAVGPRPAHLDRAGLRVKGNLPPQRARNKEGLCRETFGGV